MQYNADNLVSQATDGNGIVSTYSYDLRQRLLAVARGDGSSTGYQYDRDGNLLAVTSILAPGATPQTTSYVYDALNRLTTETHADGRQTTYTYDAAGHMTSRTDAAGTTSYHYNALGEMDRLTDRLGQVTTFTYDTDGNQTEIDYPGGIVRKVGYNADGTTTSIDVTAQVDGTQQTDVQLAYTFWDEQLQQPTPQPTQQTDMFGDTITTTYGPGGTVQNVTMVDTNGRFVSSSTYTWNAAGQCTSEVDNNAATSFTDVTTTYTYDDSGQLAAINGAALTHDGTGRILDNTVATFQYDQANQVTSFTPNGGTLTSLGFGDGDPSNPTSIGSNTYDWSSTGIEAATVEGLAEQFTTTPDGQIIELTTPDGTYYPQSDASGSLIGEIAQASPGTVQDQCSYDEDGRSTCQTMTVPAPYGVDGYLPVDPSDLTGCTSYEVNDSIENTCIPSGMLSPMLHPVSSGGGGPIRYSWSTHFTRHSALSSKNIGGSAVLSVTYIGNGQLRLTLSLTSPHGRGISGIWTVSGEIDYGNNGQNCPHTGSWWVGGVAHYQWSCVVSKADVAHGQGEGQVGFNIHAALSPPGSGGGEGLVGIQANTGWASGVYVFPLV